MIPQQINWRPPSYFGRDDLETLMMSESAGDWVRNCTFFSSIRLLVTLLTPRSFDLIESQRAQVRISELLLGKVPEGFTFAPKHKSNAYDRAENG